MENLSLDLILLVSFVVLFKVEFILFHVLPRVGGFRKFLIRYDSFVKSQLVIFDVFKIDGAENSQEREFDISSHSSCSSNLKIYDNVVTREDIEVVMEKLSLFRNTQDENLNESFCSDEISNLFKEVDPSFEELKGAFDVFDENKDGLIDVKELHRVFCILGMKEGFEMESCKMMIEVFDENRDDRIDFSEFMKVIESKS